MEVMLFLMLSALLLLGLISLLTMLTGTVMGIRETSHPVSTSQKIALCIGMNLVARLLVLIKLVRNEAKTSTHPACRRLMLVFGFLGVFPLLSSLSIALLAPHITNLPARHFLNASNLLEVLVTPIGVLGLAAYEWLLAHKISQTSNDALELEIAKTVKTYYYFAVVYSLAVVPTLLVVWILKNPLLGIAAVLALHVIGLFKITKLNVMAALAMCHLLDNH